jgi:Flp pilus assembly protein TadD
MRVIRQTLIIVAVVMISSCATLSGPQLSDSQKISTEMLLDDSPLATGVELADLSQVDILELSPAMTAFLDRWVSKTQTDRSRLYALLQALMGDGTFEIVYDDTTRTAQETFLVQRGNCLSFTSMFVAMARYVGLNADFQEVMVPPDWSLEGETFVLSQHINVRLNLEYGYEKVVDFNMYNFRTRYDMKVVSDRRGRAHYFNNIGVEHMLEGDTLLAFANFRESLREDKSFSPAWANLGILYKREAQPNYAEAAYLQAIDTDSRNLVAMSNLAGLYQQQGRSELADQVQNKIESHRMQNPYFRYQLARTAFEDGDYTTAIDHLKFAVRKNEYDDSFFFLMSLSYLNSGDKEAAQHWMQKAEEVAEMDIDKKRYHNKFDLLMSDGIDS